ncbi:hypothetical protein KSP39_PZI005698 [Platanthera zijinensis]|uniref:Uncharacterized protein n=1 Tax=Platanthera zijinensis TaxID=2320716 RepID=A0AAP0BT33_9ASPA
MYSSGGDPHGRSCRLFGRAAAARRGFACPLFSKYFSRKLTVQRPPLWRMPAHKYALWEICDFFNFSYYCVLIIGVVLVDTCENIDPMALQRSAYLTTLSLEIERKLQKDNKLKLESSDNRCGRVETEVRPNNITDNVVVPRARIVISRILAKRCRSVLLVMSWQYNFSVIEPLFDFLARYTPLAATASMAAAHSFQRGCEPTGLLASLAGASQLSSFAILVDASQRGSLATWADSSQHGLLPYKH